MLPSELIIDALLSDVETVMEPHTEYDHDEPILTAENIDLLLRE